MNALISFQSASEESLLSTCRVTKEAAELAIWTHYLAAMDFKASKWWKPSYKSWEAACADNPNSLYSASYYRTLQSALPIAQAVELVTGEMLLPTAARGIQAKINEIVPDDERAPEFVLAMLGLSYAAYPDAIVPARNVLAEAYEVLAKERDSGAIDYEGKTYNYKDLAQVAQLRERVAMDIAARSTRSTIEIAETRHLGLLLRLARRLGYSVPTELKQLFWTWKD